MGAKTCRRPLLDADFNLKIDLLGLKNKWNWIEMKRLNPLKINGLGGEQLLTFLCNNADEKLAQN